MFIVFLIILILIFYKLFFVLKLHIDWKSLFRRGFQKIDNAFGLYCYCGKQGKGKTYSAIKFLIERKIANNYTIITNVKSFNTFKDTIYMKSIESIIDYCTQFKDNEKNIIIFFDEIFTILEKKTPINKKILSFLSQMRKRKIILVTTAQEWSEIPITFRRYVRYQIDCNMFALPFLKTAFIFNKINDGDLIKWDNDSQEFIAPTIATNFSKGNRSIIESYDTYETIEVSK